MDRYAIFVDAGYFFSAGAQAAFGRTVNRKDLYLTSCPEVFSALCEKAGEVTKLPLLRAYWYDAVPGRDLSLEQSTLAKLSGLKLRLGSLNGVGQQKGVDSLIVTDLIDLARNRAIADAVVVSGDEDLRIAVQIAQSFGVRVHILAVGEADRNVSLALQMEADSVSELRDSWLVKYLVVKDTLPSSPVQIREQEPEGGIEKAALVVIESMVNELTQEQRSQLVKHFTSSQKVPPEYDAPLIARVSTSLSSRRFSGDEMRHIRGLFVRKLRE